MAKVGVVIDSGVSVPEELLKEYDIEVVPLVTVFGDKFHRDRIDLKTPSELFDLIKKSDKFPTTSAPSPTAYLESYRRLGQKVDSIVHVAMSSKLSVSFNSAAMARDMAENELPDVKIEVFDSMTTVGAAGFIALAAARAGAAGKNLAQVVKIAEEVRLKVTMIFIMDTLSYLAKSGRIGRAQALMGNVLSIKPIVEIPTSSGRVEPVARVRTKPKAVNNLLEIVKQRVGTEKPVHIMVEHTAVPEEAERLKKTVSEQFDCAELLLCEFNPTGAVTVGPGNLGLSFYLD
ncbi:MAG: DegV family protein [Dehalococcoidia bacterium]|jgi:DegV family protein with EDD domain